MRPTARGRVVGILSRHAFLIVICLAALYPLYFIGATAIRSNAAYQLNPTGFPSHPTLDALRSMILHQPLPRWMWNSLLVTVSSVAASTFMALLAAYAVVFGRFRGHKVFLSTSVALMVVPPGEVTASRSSTGCSPESRSIVAAPKTACLTISSALDLGMPSRIPASTMASTRKYT